MRKRLFTLTLIALLAATLPHLAKWSSRGKAKTYDDFVHATSAKVNGAHKLKSPLIPRILIFVSSFFTLIYLAWRVRFL